MSSKQREALEALRQVSRVAEEMTRKTITGESEDRKTVDDWALRLCDIVSTAFAKPLRNCDVGTAEEQDERWNKSCKYFNETLPQYSSCHGCPVHDEMGKFGKTLSCELVWAQMPFTKGETK